VSFVSRIFIGLVALQAVSARADSYLMQLEYEPTTARLGLPNQEPVTFWERFEFAFVERAERVFTDRFHSLNTMNWQAEMASRTADDFREHTSHVASRAFARSVTTSFRDAAFTLPIMVWLKDRQGFLADLVKQSVDSEDEEAVAPLDPSYRVLERSWWRRLAKSRDLHYGLRPFRTSPYLFVSKGFWHGDTLLVLADLRYHYEDFANHKFEFALSVPLTQGFSIDLGTAYQMNRHDDAMQMVLKLSKQFSRGGIVHVGMEVQEHPRFQVGLSLPL
jgi:hypothetical protein